MIPLGGLKPCQTAICNNMSRPRVSPNDFGASRVDLNHSNYAGKLHLTRYAYLLIPSATDFMDCREETFESYRNNYNSLALFSTKTSNINAVANENQRSQSTDPR